MGTLLPSQFLDQARAQGFIFSVKPGDKLAVKPPASGAMTDSVRRYVRVMKPELLRLLRAPDARLCLSPARPLIDPAVDIVAILQRAVALLNAGELSPWSWKRGQGCLVEDVRLWLQIRLDEAAVAHRLARCAEDPEGDAWSTTRYGRRIAEDLAEFAIWYAPAPVEEANTPPSGPETAPIKTQRNTQ